MPVLTRYVVLLLALVLSCEDDEPPLNPVYYGKDDGESCTSSYECHGGVCLSDFAGWPQGYCTTSDCENTECRGDNTACVALDEVQTMCFVTCETATDCRTGYVCDQVSGQKVCRSRTTDGPSPGDTGSGCTSNTDCNGDLVCETSLPGGYCLSRDCETCDASSACASIGSQQMVCAGRCEETRDCRPGYVCDDNSGNPVCAPFDKPAPTVSYPQTKTALGIQCNAVAIEAPEGKHRWEIPFTVDPSWSSYTIVPTVEKGRLDIVSIERPSGSIDLVNTYVHHNLRAVDEPLDIYDGVGVYGTVSYDWPVMVPYAPKFADLFEPGAHKVRLSTDGAEPCLYVLPGNDEGTTLDLNIHLFGVPGVTAASAPTNGDIQEVLDKVNELYQTVGVSLGEVRFVDGDRESSERYQIVRGFGDLRRVTALGQPRSADLDGHLFVDVFWVEDILVGQTSGLILGLSAGVPGPPGMHGNANNGLVFRLADLGVDNEFVAHIMAHELAHYLGLRHTTETLHGATGDEAEWFKSLVDTQDPLDDTPVCENILSLGFRCADASNLMFPAIPVGVSSTISLSPEQGQVLRWNALIK